jgi:hypothetical protein
MVPIVRPLNVPSACGSHDHRRVSSSRPVLLGVSFDDTGFEELHELCAAAGDKVSLAIGMSGEIMALAINGRPAVHGTLPRQSRSRRL